MRLLRESKDYIDQFMYSAEFVMTSLHSYRGKYLCSVGTVGRYSSIYNAVHALATSPCTWLAKSGDRSITSPGKILLPGLYFVNDRLCTRHGRVPLLLLPVPSNLPIRVVYVGGGIGTYLLYFSGGRNSTPSPPLIPENRAVVHM